MSFWPFTSSLNNNSSLQKFLDSVQDKSAIRVEDLLGDPTISQELISELHSIKGIFNNLTSLKLLQQQQQGGGQYDTPNGEVNDQASTTSSNVDNGNSHTKNGRAVKLIEILIQPHILSELLDYLKDGVDFFYQLNTNDEKSLGEDSAMNNDIVEAEDIEQNPKGSEEEKPDEKMRRCIQAASDVLSIDIWILSSRIIETPSIMGKLWSILLLPHLQQSSPVVVCLYRVLEQVMDSDTTQFLNFVRKQPDLVDIFLDKIDITMLQEFFLRIIQTDKVDNPTGILERLSSQKLIPKLIDILRPADSQFEPSSTFANPTLFFRQTAVTEFIKSLVTISSNTALAVVLETNIGPNELTRELVSSKIIKIMIDDIMLYKVTLPDGRVITNKHGINNCVSIIIELIRKNNSDYDLNCGSYSSLLQGGENGTGEVNSLVVSQWLKDFEQNPPGPRDPIYLGEMLYLFSDRLDEFSKLIQTKPIAPLHVEDKILGFTRFKISELIAELLHCSNMVLLNSKRVSKIVKIRDKVRGQQQSRIKLALSESLGSNTESPLKDMTVGIVDMSLENIRQNEVSEFDAERMTQSELEDIFKSYDDLSDDDEPYISPDHPFVTEERAKGILTDPCVGDYFKSKLLESSVLYNVISKMVDFPWNNFFHNVVFDLIQQIFNGKLNSFNSFLIVDLFREDKCDLINMIIKSYTNKTEPRPGYMGHIILISEEVVKFSSLYKPDLVSPIIVDSLSSNEWDWFVNEILLKTRAVYNVVPGAEQDDHIDTADDDFGFDSSTVGYLDIDAYNDNPSQNKNVIILGDNSNHDIFIKEHQNVLNGDDDEEEGTDSQMPDMKKIQSLSPSEDLDNMNTEDYFDDEQEFEDNSFLDNLSGSSSSDDEDDHSNDLRRVSRHRE